MKIQLVLILTAVIILTTLVAQGECIGPAIQAKRECQEKAKRDVKNLREVKRNRGMESREFDDNNE